MDQNEQWEAELRSKQEAQQGWTWPAVAALLIICCTIIALAVVLKQ